MAYEDEQVAEVVAGVGVEVGEPVTDLGGAGEVEGVGGEVRFDPDAHVVGEVVQGVGEAGGSAAAEESCRRASARPRSWA